MLLQIDSSPIQAQPLGLEKVSAPDLIHGTPKGSTLSSSRCIKAPLKIVEQWLASIPPLVSGRHDHPPLPF